MKFHRCLHLRPITPSPALSSSVSYLSLRTAKIYRLLSATFHLQFILRLRSSSFSSFYLSFFFLISHIAWKREVNLVSRYDERWKDISLRSVGTSGKEERVPSKQQCRNLIILWFMLLILEPRRSSGVGALCIREPESETYEGSDWVLSKWHLVSRAAN